MRGLTINLEFCGGAEFLFEDNKKDHVVVVPNENDNLTVKDLLLWIKKEMLKDCYRPEYLIDGDKVSPGVLVLINERDWELMENEDTKLKEGDTVTFLSTLHGG